MPHTPLSWRIGLFGLAAAALLLAVAAADVLGPRGRAACGVVFFPALIAALSENLRAVRWRCLGGGMALQIGFAVLIFQVPGVYEGFEFVARRVTLFLDFTKAGTGFVFGPLADYNVVDKSFPKQGFIFAFMALPTIIFVASFFTVLFHLGVLQLIVKAMARVMMHLMGTSGAESLSAAANVFMGQTEAPLIIKPYVPRMTESELFALMTGGMATVSGGILAAILATVGPEQAAAIAPALLATSVMAAPCSLYLSKLLIPETGEPETYGTVRVSPERPHRNVIDAAAGGATDGLMLALNVAAVLIAFLAFIAMFDAILEAGRPGLTLKFIFGQLFYPIAALLGIDFADVPAVANLLGLKLTTNEMVAFGELKSVAMSERSARLAAFALTGFANFSSIGIQIGGIGGLAPQRRADLARLGGRALLVGFAATLLNASVAGLLLP